MSVDVASSSSASTSAKKRRGSSLPPVSENGPIKRQKSENDVSQPTGDRYDSDVSVLQYKCRAMLVRLDEKNRTISHLRSRVTSTTQRQQHYERVMARVDAHWRQWQDDLTMLIHGYMAIQGNNDSHTKLPPLPTINSSSHQCTATVSPLIELLASPSENHIHIKQEPNHVTSSSSRVKRSQSSRASCSPSPSPPPPPISASDDSLDGKSVDELYAHIRQHLEDGGSFFDQEDEDVEMDGSGSGSGDVSMSPEEKDSGGVTVKSEHGHVNGISDHQQESLVVDKALREKTADTMNLLRLIIQHLKPHHPSLGTPTLSSLAPPNPALTDLSTSTSSTECMSDASSMPSTSSSPSTAAPTPLTPSQLDLLTQLYVRHRHALHHLYNTRQQLVSARSACADTRTQLLDAQAELQRTHRKLDRVIRDLKDGKLAKLLGQAQQTSAATTTTQSSSTTSQPNHAQTSNATSTSTTSSSAPSSSPNASPLPVDLTSSSSSLSANIPAHDPARAAAAMAILDTIAPFSAPDKAVERCAALYECAIEWRARAETREQDNEELRKDKMDLLQQNNMLRTQASTDEFVTQSAAYRTLEQQCATYKAETAQLKQQVEKLRAELADLGAASERNRDFFANADAVRTARLQALDRDHSARVAELQAQIVQLTKERNDANNRADKQGVFSTPTLALKDKLVSEYEMTNKKQLEELNNLKAEIIFNKSIQEADPNYAEAIRLNKHQHYLYRRYRAKEKEWKDKENTFRTTLETIKDKPLPPSDVLQLRFSESKLQEENKTLKEQVEQLRRSQDTKLVDELERVKEECKIEHETCDALMAEMDELSKSYDEMQSQNARLLAQATERDKAISQLYSERSKVAQAQAAVKTEREVMTKKLTQKESQCSAQDSLIAKHESTYKATSELLQKTKDQMKLLEANIEPLKHRINNQQHQIGELQAQLSEHKKIAEKANVQWKEELQRAEMLNTDITKIRETFVVMEKQQAIAKKKLQAQQNAVKTAVNESELEVELKVVKSRLRCQVCSDRDKSVVITKCFHLFCRECIDTNIKTRHRKCPGCGIPFGIDDVKPVYLT